MTAIRNFGKKYIKNEVNFKSVDIFPKCFSDPDSPSVMSNFFHSGWFKPLNVAFKGCSRGAIATTNIFYRTK